MNELTIVSKHELCVEVSGSINHQTCQQFIKEIDYHLQNSKCDTLVLDVNNVKSLDGSGVGVLITLLICMKHHNKKLYLNGLNGQPKQVLTQLEIINFFMEKVLCHSQFALPND